MKKYLKWIILGVILIAAIVIFLISRTETTVVEEEYQPEEEISSQEERKTLVSLYFRNKTTKEIEPEGRLVDVKNLVKEPYTTLIDLLIEGPKNDSLEAIIPKETKVNGVVRKNDLLELDLSNEFIQNQELTKEDEEDIIKSIVNTLTELTEVNEIKILIDGEENKSFANELVNFNTNFAREE